MRGRSFSLQCALGSEHQFTNVHLSDQLWQPIRPQGLHRRRSKACLGPWSLESSASAFALCAFLHWSYMSQYIIIKYKTGAMCTSSHWHGLDWLSECKRTVGGKFLGWSRAKWDERKRPVKYNLVSSSLFSFLPFPLLAGVAWYMPRYRY